MKTKEKGPKLVLIEWEDAQSVTTRWAPLDYLADDRQPLPVKSVGWLVQDTKEAMVLVPHVSGGGAVREFGCGDLCIPKKGIVKWRELR